MYHPMENVRVPKSVMDRVRAVRRVIHEVDRFVGEAQYERAQFGAPLECSRDILRSAKRRLRRAFSQSKLSAVAWEVAIEYAIWREGEFSVDSAGYAWPPQAYDDMVQMDGVLPYVPTPAEHDRLRAMWAAMETDESDIYCQTDYGYGPGCTSCPYDGGAAGCQAPD